MNKEEIEKDIFKKCAIGIDYGQGESQSALSREIEMLEVKNNIDNGMNLATRTYRVYDYIMDSIKEYGEISQFKEDVLYIIHGLLERQLPQKELTATQIVIENRDKEMQLEREKYLRKELEQKKSILDKVTDKLNKNQASDYQVLTKTEDRLRKMSRKEYDTNGNGRYLADLRDILLSRIEYQQEILNIIEGEKK